MNNNKKVRLYVNGKRKKDIYLSMTKLQIFKYNMIKFLKKTFMVTSAGVIIGLALVAGGYFYPQVETKVVKATEEVEMHYPVLDRIAKAESYNSQFCTKEIVAKHGCKSWEIGSVLVVINSNGTYDIGRYAINSTHLSEAIKLGYDVYKEQDNFEFAKYLFRNQGSEPWSASKYNWNK